MAIHARCTNCGCFRAPVPVVPQGDLFGTVLPFPTMEDPFSSFHRRSREREALAASARHDRAVGAERQARRDFTHRALAHQTGDQTYG